MGQAGRREALGRGGVCVFVFGNGDDDDDDK
jgi:hypothetical protein